MNILVNHLLELPKINMKKYLMFILLSLFSIGFSVHGHTASIPSYKTFLYCETGLEYTSDLILISNRGPNNRYRIKGTKEFIWCNNKAQQLDAEYLNQLHELQRTYNTK